MVRVIGFLVVAGLLAAAAQPYVVAGDLEGTLICDELGQGMTYQQQIAIANPLVLQKEFRFAFAIRATASGPVSGVSVTFLNGFLDFAPHAHAFVEWVDDTAVVTIRAGGYPSLPFGVPV